MHTNLSRSFIFRYSPDLKIKLQKLFAVDFLSKRILAVPQNDLLPDMSVVLCAGANTLTTTLVLLNAIKFEQFKFKHV